MKFEKNFGGGGFHGGGGRLRLAAAGKERGESILMFNKLNKNKVGDQLLAVFQ
jgi:hypothetical protein